MQRDRKMKRFVKVYLTMFVVAILTTNLVLVLIYGQQFLFSATTDSLTQNTEINRVVFIINGVVIVIFAIFWAVANYYYQQSKKVISLDNSKEW